MDNKKVELLAPAGNYQSFLGAVKAGADAVYLGGEKFSARAFADNFSKEEIIRAISYAHMFQRKVYMAVNTLCKEQEMDELLDYLEPFYLAGLDGVIIQDFGVFIRIKEKFPLLELHASTQMTITGVNGARFLKEMGAKRIVPARELTLEEIIRIKQETGLELETFIHGAMCYCYSGQCLFSSLLGGRSGNRGRCAQPCRLPYSIGINEGVGKAFYPLSLKDMCTVTMLPQLIDAGIDSFKIEGRMKKAEYVAGVTSIYRKYIDLYYENKGENYCVEKKDLDILSGLYIRSDMQSGYYHRYNGPEMITRHSPAYSGSEPQIVETIYNEYLESPLKIRIKMEAEFEIDKPVSIILSVNSHEHESISVKMEGKPPQIATKQPITIENIKNSLTKLGNTFFYVEEEDICISLQEGLFYSLKDINELRRKAVIALEEKLSDRTYEERIINRSENKPTPINEINTLENRQQEFSVLVSSVEQLNVVLNYTDMIDTIYLESDLLLTQKHIIKMCKDKMKLYIALPYMIRNKDCEYLQDIYPFLEEADGCLVRNVETYGFLTSQSYHKEIRTDAGMYCFNHDSFSFWSNRVEKCCIPYELNAKEIKELVQVTSPKKWEQIIYGRIPLMVSANCIAKTDGKCNKGKSNNHYVIKDRMNKIFPISIRCKNCYNIIYNSVVLSLHEKVQDNRILTGRRIQFTIETEKETEEVLQVFLQASGVKDKTLPFSEYTLGHDKRGVE